MKHLIIDLVWYLLYDLFHGQPVKPCHTLFCTKSLLRCSLMLHKVLYRLLNVGRGRLLAVVLDSKNRLFLIPNLVPGYETLAIVTDRFDLHSGFLRYFISRLFKQLLLILFSRSRAFSYLRRRTSRLE